MPSVRRYAFVVAASLILGSTVGGTVAAVLVPGTIPASLATADGVETVTPSKSEFDDPHQVRVVLTVDATAGLRSPVGGVLTSTSCLPGRQILSGTAPFSVDGRAVVALATSVPLWRSIRIGDDGADVAALEAEVARLGAELEPDGVWDWGDAGAFDSVLAVPTDEGGTAQLASLAWLPAQAVEPAECPPAVGGSVAPGDVVARFGPRITLASVAPPAGALEGPRVLVLAGATVALDGESVTDPIGLAAIAESAEFAAIEPGQTPPTITAMWVLSTPIEVTVVPPSAVFGLIGPRGCVHSDGEAVAVTVIASQLGRTLVQASRPLGRVLVHPDVSASCP